MESVNFVILGDQEIATDFGKKGTSTDLTLYDRKEAQKIYTFVIPNGFPEKIQPLFQAIALAEYVIFHVNALDKFTGEQILALDALGKKEGILSHSYDVDEARLDLMIKGTVLEGYKKVEQDKIKEELVNFPTAKKDGSTSIVIDHTFDVKGVGTVALGKVLSGKITQYDKIQSLIKSGIDEGATLVAGGPEKPEDLKKGYFIKPTVFTDVNNNMRIAKEEIFGPVLSIIPFENEDEAIKITNDTEYGLGNYLQTEDKEKAKRVSKKLRSGIVYVNHKPADSGTPFGGYRQSGNGREGGTWGLHEYLEVKTITEWKN